MAMSLLVGKAEMPTPATQSNLPTSRLTAKGRNADAWSLSKRIQRRSVETGEKQDFSL